MANEFKISELERVKTIGSSILGTDRLILNNGNPQTTRAITMDDLVEYLPDDVGVARINPGSNVSISPSDGVGDVTISVPTGAGGVSRIIAGTYLSVTPNNGRGEVTISVERGAGGVTQIVPGNNISINPGSGVGTVEITANIPTFDPGVTRIIPGTGVTISPNNGLGEVTINAIPVDIPEPIDPGVIQILGGNNITVNPSNGTGTVTIDATVPDPGVTKITAGNNISISPGSGEGNVTINADGGTTNFDPIFARFTGLDFQVRFLGRLNWSNRNIDEFNLYKRTTTAPFIQEVGNTVKTPYINAAGLGGMLTAENWPISFENPNGVEGQVMTPIDITFPPESNCALVIIQQKARVLHNFMRASAMNNTHLAYYTRIAGLPITGGSFTWKFPGITLEDEGNTGDIIGDLPYITQLAMGHCPAMTGSITNPSGPSATLGGLELCYRYGQDVNNLIIAYCEFTPGVNGNYIRFYHNNRILRSKRSIFDISGASMTFFPLYKTAGAPFPGASSFDAAGIDLTPTDYLLAKTNEDVSGIEDSIFGGVTEENTADELAEDLREEIQKITSSLLSIHDYGNLTPGDEAIVVTAIEELLELKSTPVVPGGSLGDNIDEINDKLNEIVYDNADIMRIGSFKFPFEEEFSPESTGLLF
jgi:hypothetical protein